MVAFKASMLVLRAIVSMVEETVWTWFIAEAKPAMRSPSWTTSSVRPLKPSMVPSIASRPGLELGLGLLGQQPRLVGGIADTRAWSPSSRVVTSSSWSSIFRCSPMRSATPFT